METFIELKKYFLSLGITPDGKSHLNIRCVVIILLLTYCCVAMSVFFLFEAKSTIDFGNSFYGATCLGTESAIILSNALKRNKIYEFLTRSEKVINERPSRSNIYEKVNVKIEKYTKIFHELGHITIVSLYVPISIASYWRYYTTDLGSDAFQQTFPMSMPFDWKTPIGYAITLSTISGAWVFLHLSICCIICFLGGACWLLVAMIEDIAIDFHSLNEVKDNGAQIKTKLNENIHFHSTVKQFAHDLSEIYEIIITSIYLWSLLTICCSLFLVNLETSRGVEDPLVLLLASLEMFWSFVFIFVFCDFGEKVSQHISEMDNVIYHCNWYEFPVKIQRIFPIIMISAQEPVILTGFGNLSCTREAFKKIVNGGVSYFMTFRKMYH